jgi:hypothetical protein
MQFFNFFFMLGLNLLLEGFDELTGCNRGLTRLPLGLAIFTTRDSISLM